MRKRTLGFVALGAAASIFLSACGGGDTGESGDAAAAAGYDAGSTQIVNPSDQTGGTLRYAISSDFDSTDPGDTYYGFSWNFTRYYARTLLAFTPAPAEASTELTTDLAAGMPEPNENFTEWTVKIQEGLKYEDGSEITAQDIKYAIARSNYNGGELPNGPRYFESSLDQEPFNVYDVDDPMATFTAVETPDDYTLVFHLKESFSEFPYILTQPQTAPVPQEADRGALYRENVLSSGPYKFDGAYEPGVKLNLVRNEHWDPETDPIRPALPDEVTVEIGVEQNEIDQRLVNGELDVDLSGVGVGPAMKSQFLQDLGTYEDNLDNPLSGALRYVNIHTPVLDTACRQAIAYAADRDSLHRAWGGDTGGDLATNLLPPTIPGSDPEANLYPSEDNKGDLEAAQEKLEECGEPEGFDTVIAVRDGRPNDLATAESLQESLKRVGIELEIKTFPAEDFFAQYAGSQDYVRENNIGLSVSGWIPDWASGYGFGYKITAGDAIQETGNYNTSELDDPEVNELWDQALTTEDPDERADIYGQIDTLVMEQAAILPVVFDRAMFYRSDELTNVYYTSSYAMYDYMALGVNRG
ncbi:ABC transporter substrate-binding protein [Nocardiopsis changdeensis]|uniref:ABC transporter substrate-binding protein n=1 Tax=Nocardiopsis changdeensis TaxID=2831969 RepID=UPI003F48F03E